MKTAASFNYLWFVLYFNLDKQCDIIMVKAKRNRNPEKQLFAFEFEGSFRFIIFRDNIRILNTKKNNKKTLLF
jgi:hypothetical protein